MLICSYIDEYFDIADDTFEIPNKWTMINAFDCLLILGANLTVL